MTLQANMAAQKSCQMFTYLRLEKQLIFPICCPADMHVHHQAAFSELLNSKHFCSLHTCNSRGCVQKPCLYWGSRAASISSKR